jgi:hypothetical protein
VVSQPAEIAVAGSRLCALIENSPAAVLCTLCRKRAGDELFSASVRGWGWPRAYWLISRSHIAVSEAPENFQENEVQMRPWASSARPSPSFS